MQKRVKSIVLVVCAWLALSVVGTNFKKKGTSVLQVDAAAWKRLQRLDVGTRLKITVGTPEAVERYFVQLNDSEIIVLNLTGKNLPRRQLLRMAADNPGWIADTSKTTYRDNSLRIGPDGLFVKDQKVAELADIVERVPRDRITSITKG